MDTNAIIKELVDIVQAQQATIEYLTTTTDRFMKVVEALKTQPIITTPPTNEKVSKFQANCLFATAEANGVPRFMLSTLLSQFDCNTGYTHDLLAIHFDEAQKALVELAKKHNPHYPIQKKLKDGTINPEWMAKING